MKDPPPPLPTAGGGYCFKLPRPGFLRRPARLTGWRGSVLLFCVTSWILLLPNAAISSALATIARYPSAALEPSISSITITKGDCDKIERSNFWIHMFMNIMSFILVAATAWSGLTRPEVDLVHASGETVDVGIPSVRNMMRIRSKRLLLWAFMMLVALSLHLVFNSAVYKSTPSSSYWVHVVTPRAFNDTFSTTLQGQDGIIT
ncbi:hypothetical protein B0T22DRAFT_476039 [Podospora appendiculata]|uniref:DUF6536 domain-containing protein n=1 Tax=Podospora appendiculata TaxID=314037 RepID=A0AAE0XH48_9PEZI|nr:hypothetical protein B0T22DRAFT_476039 [Podospora appendiculata]